MAGKILCQFCHLKTNGNRKFGIFSTEYSPLLRILKTKLVFFLHRKSLPLLMTFARVLAANTRLVYTKRTQQSVGRCKLTKSAACVLLDVEWAKPAFNFSFSCPALSAKRFQWLAVIMLTRREKVGLYFLHLSRRRKSLGMKIAGGITLM